MQMIPIYDDTAPIACTAESEELSARIEQLERLRTNLVSVERTEHGIVVHFPNRPEIEEDLRRFAIDEKGCCSFWGFDIVVDGDGLILRWDGPPAVDDFMDRLVASLEGDEPLTASSGLL